MGEWRFLLDENVDPKVETYLSEPGVDAEHVREALWLGADDESDVLPYARANDLIVVTSDITDFAALPGDEYPGFVILYDDTTEAYRIAAGLLAMVDAYPLRREFPGREVLDDWL